MLQSFSTIPIAKVSHYSIFEKPDVYISFIACGCNEQGVEKDDLTCGDKDGKCNCKCNVRGNKCNECEVGHYGFPKCTGKFYQTSIFNSI